jgi:hypothetical protein
METGFVTKTLGFTTPLTEFGVKVKVNEKPAPWSRGLVL